MELSIVVPTHKDAVAAIRLITALEIQISATPIRCEIIVVDDGSCDDTAQRIRASAGPFTTIIELSENVGRAAARNIGAKQASGKIIIFTDSDCVPADSNFVTAHLHATRSTNICSAGSVRGEGNGFWNNYYLKSRKRLKSQVIDNSLYVFTSANFAISRHDFFAAHGFDERYRGYGFEDRDLAIRLLKHGVFIVHNEFAAVVHEDRISLGNVCRKMRDAGRTTSLLFSHDHPIAYEALGYAAVDARLSSWLTPVVKLSNPLVRVLIKVVEPTLDQSWIPFSLRAALVKALSALSFSYGTTIKPERAESNS